jgi:hypothetical protein
MGMAKVYGGMHNGRRIFFEKTFERAAAAMVALLVYPVQPQRERDHHNKERTEYRE